MMDNGNIVLDVQGEERAHMTVPDLLERFRSGAGKDLDNDRICCPEDRRPGRRAMRGGPVLSVGAHMVRPRTAKGRPYVVASANPRFRRRESRSFRAPTLPTEPAAPPLGFGGDPIMASPWGEAVERQLRGGEIEPTGRADAPSSGPSGHLPPEGEGMAGGRMGPSLRRRAVSFLVMARRA